MNPVSIPEAIALLPGPYVPKDLATVNDAILRVARLEGAFPFHRHEEDELFLCWDGTFRIELDNEEVVTLSPASCSPCRRVSATARSPTSRRTRCWSSASRPASTGTDPHDGHDPRVIFTQRYSSTSLTGDEPGRPRAAGTSSIDTPSRADSLRRAAAISERYTTYASPPPPRPNEARIGSSHGGKAWGRSANSSFAAAVSPNATSTSPSRSRRRAAGTVARSS